TDAHPRYRSWGPKTRPSPPPPRWHRDVAICSYSAVWEHRATSRRGGAGRVEPRAGTRAGGVELGGVGDLGVETSEGLLGGDGRGDPMRAGAHRDVPLRVAGEGGIGDDGPGRGRAERGDRAALVASDVLRDLLVRHRQAVHAEQSAQ